MRSGTRDLVVDHILSDAGLVVFEPKGEDDFELIAGSPWWMPLLVADVPLGTVLGLKGRFPFLDHFLVLARDHWQHGDPAEVVRSGLWMEEVAEEEIPLEATARTVGSRKILVIESSREAYENARFTMQRARESLLNNEVLERAVRERTEMIRAREEEIAVRLVSAAEFRDSATGAHIRRIGRLSLLLGGALRLPPDVLDYLELAAAMHDVGKIGIPDHILLKRGPLDDEERAIMQQHTLVGARILEGSEAAALQMARTIALCHHERWDGSGYPRGLAGTEIPLVARIVTVVDFFDATANDRPYRPAMPLPDVLELMRSRRGRHFDPDVLDLFLSLQDQVAEIRAEVDAAVAEEQAELVGSQI